MKKTIRVALAGLLMVPALALGISLVAPAPDTLAQLNQGLNASNPNNSGNNLPTTLTGTGGVFTTVVNIALFIIGALSVIMLIYGGIRYTVSGGDSGSVTSAKNTILYAIIGLVVAIFAYAIVNWVIGAASDGTVNQ